MDTYKPTAQIYIIKTSKSYKKKLILCFHEKQKQQRKKATAHNKKQKLHKNDKASVQEKFVRVAQIRFEEEFHSESQRVYRHDAAATDDNESVDTGCGRIHHQSENELHDALQSEFEQSERVRR